ncbi:MAG: type II toxin-antitoxin system YafQ family toxin [Thiothrix sp.]|nr:MAG: type II toxin-antitoxin system YafQ family toxin [Thiothrix sp.]
MRKIERTTAFKRDFKRHGELDASLIEVLWKLANDAVLPESYRDHALTGNWVDFRECHIHPDVLLIYRKLDEHTLQLVRLGSHSELDL